MGKHFNQTEELESRKGSEECVHLQWEAAMRWGGIERRDGREEEEKEEERGDGGVWAR